MSGDTVSTLAEIGSSVSFLPMPSPGFNLIVKSHENGKQLNSDACVNGDRSFEDEDVEMKGRDEVLNMNGDDKVRKKSMSGEIEKHGSLDGVNASKGTCKPDDLTAFAAENGKDPNEIFIENTVPFSEMRHSEDECDKEHKFQVGEFIWGKIRNNPWWPGRIYDPSDASDYAKKLQNKKKMLVAYFGDGSFSWCSLFQLKPFAENFDKMSKQNTSSKFKYAVQEALDEMGRIVKSKLSCSFARPLAVNSGIREGVLVPNHELSELSIPQLERFDVFSLIRNIAKMGYSTNMLEFTVLKSWLFVFYRARGGYELAMFYEPLPIDGLEDSRNGLVDVDKDSSDDDRSSMPGQHESNNPNQPWLRECDGIVPDKIFKRRKRKSVAKLMKESKVDVPNGDEGNFDENSKLGKRKTRAIEVDERKKPETIKSLEEVLSTERVGDENKKQKKQKALSSLNGFGNSVLSAKNDNGEGQMVSEEKNKQPVTDETDSVAASRVKRKSISLCKDSKGKNGEKGPNLGNGDLDSPLEKEAKKRKKSEIAKHESKNEASSTKKESPKITEKKESAKHGSMNKVTSSENDNQESEKGRASRERKKSMYLSPPFVNFTSISRSLSPKSARMTKVSQVIGSTHTSNNLSKEVDTSIKASPNPSLQLSKHEKKIIDSIRINVSMEKVVSEIRFAALNPLIVWDKKFLHMVENFVFAYKNINYLEGSYYNEYHNGQQGEKFKSLETGLELVSKPVSLMVIFPPGFCLPSKTAIVTLFTRFGSVNETETDVSQDSCCAKVVFSSYDVTVKAFDMCLEKSLFGSTNVRYRLRYSAGSAKANEIVKRPNMLWESDEFGGSCLLFIRQKLEIMTDMVDNCGGNMSRELLAKLEHEIKGLLDKIGAINKSSSVQRKC